MTIANCKRLRGFKAASLDFLRGLRIKNAVEIYGYFVAGIFAGNFFSWSRSARHGLR
jgi:hypothetical protein